MTIKSVSVNPWLDKRVYIHSYSSLTKAVLYRGVAINSKVFLGTAGVLENRWTLNSAFIGIGLNHFAKAAEVYYCSEKDSWKGLNINF